MNDSRTLNFLLGGAAIVFVIGTLLGWMPNKTERAMPRTTQETGSPKVTAESQQKNHLFERGESVWITPEPDSPGDKWLFDVFTPPRIYVNPETGEFEPTPYQFSKQASAPVFSVVAVDRPLFRYQLSGYVESHSIRPEEATLILQDLQTSQLIRQKIADNTELSGGYNLGSFQVSKEFNDRGAVQRVGILDIRTPEGDLIRLRTDAPTFIEGYVITATFQGKPLTLTESESIYLAGDHEIRWMQSESVYPTFVFEMKNLATDEVNIIRVESYLSSKP
jgi:hypothetical protein